MWFFLFKFTIDNLLFSSILASRSFLVGNWTLEHWRKATAFILDRVFDWDYFGPSNRQCAFKTRNAEGLSNYVGFAEL